MKKGIKIVGHCTICDKCVAEVPARIVGKDHPYDGFPLRVDGWKPEARRVVFRLADGSMMDLTFGDCKDCKRSKLNQVGVRTKIWDKVVATNQYEVDNRIAIKGPRFAGQIAKQMPQLEAQMKKMRDGGLEKVLDDEPWLKVIEREGGIAGST